MELKALIKQANTTKKAKHFIAVGREYEFGPETNFDLKEAKKWYKKAADMQSAKGVYSLALIYEQDWRSKRAQKLAFKYLLQAAHLNHKKAMERVGYILLYGDESIQKNTEEALFWLEKSTTQKASYTWLQVFIECTKSPQKSNQSKAKIWRQRILDSNDQSLIFDLAFAYEQGEDLPSSPRLARRYYEQAASLGNLDAKIEMARYLSKGLGGKKDEKSAKAYLDQVWQQKDTHFHTKIADLYQRDDYFAHDDSATFKWYKRAAELGDDYAQTEIGRFYRDGKFVKQNFDKAEFWLQKAAVQKNRSAYFSLANLYRNKSWIRKDYKKAIACFKSAKKHGSGAACSALAWMYLNGEGVKQSYKKALSWYRKGTDSYDNGSHVGIGWMYDQGLGVETDYDKAFYHYNIAAKDGDGHAMANLGSLYLKGLGCDQSFKKARKWYETGKQQENAECINSLGSLYLHGQGVKKDSSLAIEYFEKAIDLGCAPAHFNLALAYLYDQESPEDVSKIRFHWERSVLDPDAILAPAYYHMFALCHLAEFADLTPSDAVKWFNIALEKGFKQSHLKLGDIYRFGMGTNKNTELAQYHLKKSIEFGFDTAYEKLADMYRIGDLPDNNQKRQNKYYSLAYSKGALENKNSYAWLLATSKYKKIRNGKLAVQVILEDIANTKNEPNKVDTLAAAYAELGDFDSAIKEQKKAIAMFKKQKLDPEKKGCFVRLALFEKNCLYRE